MTAIRQVRQRIQRRVLYRPDADHRQQRGGNQHQHAIGDASMDQARDHGVPSIASDMTALAWQSAAAAEPNLGTNCISMNGDLPGLSKCFSGTIGSYQYCTGQRGGVEVEVSGATGAGCLDGGERADLHAAQAAVASQQDVLAHERTQALERLTQAQHEARTAETSAAALREQLRQLHDERDDLRRQRDGTSTRNELLEEQVAALRAELAQKADQHTAERDELLAHLRATEDRALTEVDRARQALQQLQHSVTAQSLQHQRELSNLSAARQQAEQTTAQALRDRDIQSALASAYASQLERLGDLPEQVRAALTPPAAPARTKAKPVRKARSG